jgi:uncharacterized Zn finger protein (UPF0148 family)
MSGTAGIKCDLCNTGCGFGFHKVDGTVLCTTCHLEREGERDVFREVQLVEAEEFQLLRTEIALIRKELSLLRFKLDGVLSSSEKFVPDEAIKDCRD